jgi:hypothetical protein
MNFVIFKFIQMKKVTPVIMTRLSLYFGLITTMTNQLLDTNFFIQLF